MPWLSTHRTEEARQRLDAVPERLMVVVHR
jgi:hypothetical protein